MKKAIVIATGDGNIKNRENVFNLNMILIFFYECCIFLFF